MLDFHLREGCVCRPITASLAVMLDKASGKIRNDPLWQKARPLFCGFKSPDGNHGWHRGQRVPSFVVKTMGYYFGCESRFFVVKTMGYYFGCESR